MSNIVERAINLARNSVWASGEDLIRLLADAGLLSDPDEIGRLLNEQYDSERQLRAFAAEIERLRMQVVIATETGLDCEPVDS